MAVNLNQYDTKRTAFKRQLKGFFIFIESYKDDIAQLRERYERIPDIWSKFQDISLEIECLLQEAEDAKSLQEHVNNCSIYEQQYYAAMAKARENLDAAIKREQPVAQPAAQAVAQGQGQFQVKMKLPPLKIQPFSGKYEDWLAFKDSFNKAVHEREDVADIQKFQILDGLLTEDAKKAISSLDATNANYEQAWNLLKERYEKKRIIVNTHVKGFFEFPAISKPNQTNLRSLVDTARTHIRSLKSLEQPIEEWSTLLIYLITSKLDHVSKEEWEKNMCFREDEEKEELPTFEELLKFLEKRCLMYEMIDRGKTKTETPQTNNTAKKNKQVALTTTAITTTTTEPDTPNTFKCIFCNDQHKIFQCEKFLKLSTEARIEEVKKRKLCLNCLRTGHRCKDCKSSSCRKCGHKHNTLLHKYQNQTTTTNDQQTINQSTSDNIVVNHCLPKQKSSIILSTARVYLKDFQGNQQECRALLDPGSQVNILSENFAKKLQLKFKSIDLPITGVNQAALNIKKSAIISLKSVVSSFSVQQECLIIPTITEKIPQISLDANKMFVPDGIELADPDFRKSGPIDLLIGAGLFWKLLIPGENISNKGQPTFQNTHLGWIVGGELKVPVKRPQASCNFLVTTTLCDQMEKFWQTEEIIDKQDNVQDEEDFCEKHFKQSYERDADGRFIVELPQNKDVILGDSYNEAYRRLLSLERRFQKQPTLKEEYSQFLSEYEDAGHMSQQNAHLQKNMDHYYIPHQPVIRTSSLTTKLRVVFDASAKTTLGTSLNDRLLPGPNLQKDIVDILLRFRIHEYVLTADIAQMFRQVRVAEKDRPLQQILWRSDPEQPVKVYTLNTVTYGTNSAPFLAMRCLRELACLERESSPEASAVLENDFYMDDLLTGTLTLEEAIQLQQQLSDLLESGKFPLRKWRANDTRILQKLESSDDTDKLLVLDQRESIKTLGLLWNSQDDVLQYSIQLLDDQSITKRKVLSAIAKIYDPLGIIGPVIIIAKMLMQEIWMLEIKWDEELPAHLQKTWRNYLESLAHLPKLRIPRNVNPRNKDDEITLHGFCDASMKAYGACIYIVSQKDNGFSQANLLCSKSRVKPLKEKNVTLPRLELYAALQLARLVSLVENALKKKLTGIYLWSDSTITLSWIKNIPIKKIYEANRVREIQNRTSNCTWRHVPSKDNPADLISRGVPVQKLENLDIWWHGPTWLLRPDDWPSSPVTIEEVSDDEEEAIIQKLVAVTTCGVESGLLDKFSKFSKLQRVLAYCYRFCYNLKRKRLNESLLEGSLTVDELELARKRIVIWVQGEAFPREIACLKAEKPLDNRSVLLALNPFLTKDGVIKVGGRLENASIPETQKHQEVLPSRHHVTHILMRDEHVRQKHCGPQQLLHVVREKYWPLSGGREARKVTRSCVPCFRYKPKVPDVIMGNLPQPRVNVSSRPFEVTGVDYAGPLQIRESKRRGNIPTSKGYIAVFTCFSSKAVHLELVTDLTTDAFLAAMRRFVSRRGLCTAMHSDNATNFVGAERELREVYEFLNKHENGIKTDLGTRGINWTFIPPRSPHFGGLWESAVKSVKKHLYTVTKGLKYTFEEYYTLLTEIEAVLNSRPLLPMSSDPNDLSALTPAHFLIGSPLLEPASECFLDVADNRLSRWQHIQKLKQHFWKRWQSEYLQHLQGRTKWKSGDNTIKVGSMVLLVDDNQPPLSWKLGRVVNAIPGADDVVRVMDVLTAQGIYRRGIKKICALPFDK